MNENEELRKIEIRTEELEEILGHPPKWIIRRGILVISSVILVLFIGSYFFKYPDTVGPSTITLTTQYPPVKIVARSTGKIQHLFVKNNQHVEKGQPLGVIENPANYFDVRYVKNKLDSIQSNRFAMGFLNAANFQPGLSLGNLQPYYTSFLRNLKDYNYFLETGQKAQKLQSLKEEMDKYQTFYKRQENQLEILKSEYVLAKKQYTRDSTLYASGTISSADLEKSETRLLQKKYAYGSMKTNMANTRIQLSSMKRNALDIRLNFDERGKSLELSLLESFDNLLAQTRIWEKQYVLKSTIDGEVTFTRFWSTNQHVNTNEEVMTVIPAGENELVARLQLQVLGSGKVKPGQQVNIKLDNYPHMEYGMVIGEVKSVSLVPSGEFFMVEVGLPNGLETNYNKQIEFVRQLQGKAEIITEDRRLIERFIEPIKSILQKQ